MKWNFAVSASCNLVFTTPVTAPTGTPAVGSGGLLG